VGCEITNYRRRIRWKLVPSAQTAACAAHLDLCGRCRMSSAEETKGRSPSLDAGEKQACVQLGDNVLLVSNDDSRQFVLAVPGRFVYRGLPRFLPPR